MKKKTKPEPDYRNKEGRSPNDKVVRKHGKVYIVTRKKQREVENEARSRSDN